MEVFEETTTRGEIQKRRFTPELKKNLVRNSICGVVQRR